MACKRCLVSGLVQGVFFRVSTREQARQLGVTGFVRNLPDGRVEVLACGSEERVAALCTWLQHGPAHARIKSCECRPAHGLDTTQFEIR
jgi:acylphosphatase